MSSTTHIQFLPNKHIDKTRWDDCVESSPQNLIYAKTFYLDNICPGWTGLTGINYEWVLPLTHRKKWGISYLYQPPFTQQLGIFAQPNAAIPFHEIIQWLKEHYKFLEISWNADSVGNETVSSFETTNATNLVIDLSGSYESISSNYHGDLKKNLARSSKFLLQYASTNDYHLCIQLYREHYGQRIAHVSEDDYRRFTNICAYAQQHNMLLCKQALDEKNDVLATALLFFDGKRLYNIMNTTTEAGRKTEANHFLLDAIIKEYAGSHVVFDFEGSDIPGVKSFYENFGAVNQPYYLVRYNRLPWPFQLFKK